MCGLVARVWSSFGSYMEVSGSMTELDQFVNAAKKFRIFHDAILLPSLSMRGDLPLEAVLPGLLLDMSTFGGHEVQDIYEIYKIFTSSWEER
jgi:hypothetical protein